MKILLRIVGYTLRYKWQLALAYLVTVGVTLTAASIPRILGEGVDTALSPGAERMQLLWLGLAIVGVSALRGLCAYGQTYLTEAIGQWVAYDLRNSFYDHLQRLSYAFHDREQTGNLMSKATADVEGIRMFVQAGLVRASYMLMLTVTVTVLLLLLSWQLALISLIFVPLVAWRSSAVMLQLRRTWLAAQNELGHLSTVVQENLSSQRVIKSFAAEEYEREKFKLRAQNVADHSYHANVLQAGNTGLVTLFYLGATALVLLVGGREVVAGTLTVGELAQFVFYLGLLAVPVRTVAWVVNAFARAVAAGDRLFAVLDAQSPVQERAGAIALPRVEGRVRFDNLCFSYGNGSAGDTAPAGGSGSFAAVAPPLDGSLPVVTGEGPDGVLNGIDFEAAPRQVVAILGAPGSGKSSLVHLILRFYDVTSGSVRIDGIDVRDVTLESLRANVGIVHQDTFLFTTTIRENIAYGAVHATEEQIREAARTAQLDDEIMAFPEGYETWVGERGVGLSGGQRQRLTIARTLLLDPPILILDDSTSSVDTETEHRIRLALQAVMRGRTTFVIAHRLSTVREAEVILVLERGRVVQQGTHRELIDQPGPYQGIYRLQLQPQEGGLAAAGLADEAARAVGGGDTGGP